MAVAATAAAMPAAAQLPAVDAARQAGLIGERFDGYLGVAVPPSAALRSQVAAINIRRRSLYSNLAASRGVSPQEVGITAGCQLLARVQPGQAYMLTDGQWRRRLPDQRPLLPDYCR
ncbi:MAG: YdbL family protein [Sphingomicrobium sp.]